MIEVHYIVMGWATSYRVRPNPDGEDVRSAGVVIEWSDDGCTTWEHGTTLSPENAEDVARSILRLMKGARK